MTAVIGYGNLIEVATVTGGNMQVGYPATNVQNRFLGIYARTIANYSTLSATFAAPVAISCAGVIATTMAAVPNVIISLQGSTDNFSTSNVTVVSENHDLHGGPDHFFTFAPTSYRYWRFVFSTGTPPPNGINFGRLFLGYRFIPHWGLSFGASSGFDTRTTREESAGGARFHRSRIARRILNGSFDNLTDDEGDLWQQIQQSHDIANEHVLIWDDADTSTKRARRNMLCNADELNELEFPYATGRKVGVKFSEIIA